MGETLEEAYQQAEANEGYDKYVVLDSNSIYTGGLGIYEGDVYINCNGSTIDLEGGNGIWVYADEQYPSSLDIEYCTIINGDYYGISYGGTSNGNITNCNLIETNFGLKLFDESNVNVTNTIFAHNQTYGIGMYTEIPTLNISYSLFWGNIEDDCMENCPGWGGIWTQLELDSESEILYLNPQFINYSSDPLVTSWDFSLGENSPCINSGNPEIFDADGSISDIGAIIYSQNCNLLGDANSDFELNVLDVVQAICIIIETSDVCNANIACLDLNQDSIINILDIVGLVNLIIR